jgi:choline dehydrogenase
MKKSQNYQAPIGTASKYGASYDETGHGIHGPVDITHSPHSYTGLPQVKFIEALNHTLQVDKIIDAATGEGNGYSYCPHFVKHGSHNTRESAATAYYDPIQYERANLHILTGWRGVRVNWEKKGGAYTSSTSFWSALQQPFGPSSKGLHEATGVTVQRQANGATYDMPLAATPAAHKREVILSSGALITPLVLELSGIGDAAVLSKLGVKRRVELPGVGRNFIEKPTNIVRNQGRNTSRVEVSGAPLPAVAMLSIEKVMKNTSDALRLVEDGMQSWAEEAVRAGGAVNVQGVLNQYKVMKRGIFEERWPVSEWEYFSKDEIAIKTFVLVPWSRGYIHSTTNNSVWNVHSDDVELNARFWTRGFDMDVQVQALRRARELLSTPLMKEVAAEELHPGTALIAHDDNLGDYADWRKYIIATYEGIHHNMGTASMMSREMGGVVNEEFQVYGTSNVRVVDASIFPLQISAHPAATLFGIAEMAADLIKGESA